VQSRFEETVMKKLLVLAVAAAAMAACAESPMAPSQAQRSGSTMQRSNDITCRSGYIVAYDENGNPYCAPAGGDGTQSMTRQP
jgi:hypothetical protein